MLGRASTRRDQASGGEAWRRNRERERERVHDCFGTFEEFSRDSSLENETLGFSLEGVRLVFRSTNKVAPLLVPYFVERSRLLSPTTPPDRKPLSSCQSINSVSPQQGRTTTIIVPMTTFLPTKRRLCPIPLNAVEARRLLFIMCEDSIRR